MSISHNAVLCMPFDKDLNDLCGNIFTIVGSPIISNEQSVFGTSSLKLDGNTYMYADITDDFKFGNGDFTIEWWEYRLGNDGCVFSTGRNTMTSEITQINAGFVDTNVNLYLSSLAQSWNVAFGFASSKPVIGQWVHRAFCRKNNLYLSFTNGQKNLSYDGGTPATLYSEDTKVLLFNRLTSSFKGYINNLLVVKGEALYTDNFTPSTSPYTKSLTLYLDENNAVWGCKA